MARPKGSIGWKKQQAYLHEKFPEQGWMEETDKERIKGDYKKVKNQELRDDFVSQSQDSYSSY